jgi:hypothetical protein
VIARNNVIRNWGKTPFENIFSGPKDKYFVLKALYNGLGEFVFGRFGKLVMGETDRMNSTLSIKKRFYNKLVNFLKVKENFDYLWNSGNSEYLSDYYLLGLYGFE